MASWCRWCPAVAGPGSSCVRHLSRRGRRWAASALITWAGWNSQHRPQLSWPKGATGSQKDTASWTLQWRTPPSDRGFTGWRSRKRRGTSRSGTLRSGPWAPEPTAPCGEFTRGEGAPPRLPWPRKWRIVWSQVLILTVQFHTSCNQNIQILISVAQTLACYSMQYHVFPRNSWFN